MRILKVNKLRGPNLWANFPVLEVWLDLEAHAEVCSKDVPGLAERIAGWLPSILDHQGSLQVPGGFAEELYRGAGLADVFEHMVLALQSEVGHEVTFGRIRGTKTPGTVRVAVEFDDEEVGLACVDKALELLIAGIENRSIDFATDLEKLRDFAYDVALGPSTRAIVNAARKRDIPWRRLNRGSLIQLGYGSYQRRICTAEADSTSAIAESIAQDKQLTRALLKAVGVPVPEGRPVISAEDAWAAAEEIGVPVVVKPQFGNHGRGVATNLTTQQQVMSAYVSAKEQGDSIVVEKFAPGDDYRLLVVGGKLVAAARREPAHVIGDGKRTIQQLIDIVNQDPRRSEGHATVLSKIPVDSISLAVISEQGFALDSIPPVGTKVLIRRNANLSTGGTATDVTDDVHPEVARQAVEAAAVIGLDIAGVDVVALDISKPLASQHAAVVEVNAGPGLRMHLEPSHGKPRAVGEAIIDMIYPEGKPSRIPIVGVTGVNGKTTTTRLVAHILGCSGKNVGMTCTDGIYVNHRRIDTGDCSGPQSAKAILLNPTVEAAVFETARGGMLREGLGFDHCDVAIVTNVGEGDHLGISDIDTKEKLAEVKRILVEGVAPHGSAILKADDPLVAAMADKCPGSVVFFALDGNHELLVKRRKEGGRVAFVRDHAIMLADGAHEIRLLTLDRIPLTHNGRVGFQVENVLASTAACWALGMPCEQIRTGLESFSAQMDKIPGRFNLIEMNGATVIVDYGHNPSSLQAMIDAIKLFPHAHRTAIYSAAGDRRDCDMVQQGEQLAAAFDRVVIYEDAYLRGREPGDITKLFKQGLAVGGRVTEIHDFLGWKKAVDATLRMIQPGELLLVQADVVDEAMQYLRDCFASQVASREMDLDSAIQPVVPPPVPSSPMDRARRP